MTGQKKIFHDIEKLDLKKKKNNFEKKEEKIEKKKNPKKSIWSGLDQILQAFV